MTRTAMILPATRRRFLSCASALFAGTVVATIPVRWSFADADAQWARLQRGLSQKSMADCRKVADRLVPRLGELLKGPQWESQFIKAIADELKRAKAIPTIRHRQVPNALRRCVARRGLRPHPPARSTQA